MVELFPQVLPPAGLAQSVQTWAEGMGGLWSDTDCGGIISWGGVVGTSIFAVAVDWLSPWVADRDPLGQVWLP